VPVNARRRTHWRRNSTSAKIRFGSDSFPSIREFDQREQVTAADECSNVEIYQADFGTGGSYKIKVSHSRNSAPKRYTGTETDGIVMTDAQRTRARATTRA